MKIHIKNGLAVSNTERGYEIKSTDIFTDADVVCALNEAPQDYKAQKVIDAGGRLVIPGLINCHTHAYMTLMRNSADDLSFDDWLFGRIMPREEKMSADQAYLGALLACVEMIKSGTVAFADMHMFPNQSLNAALKCGMRVVIGRGLAGGLDQASGGIDEGGLRRLDEALEEMNGCKENDLISFMLSPHAIYTCDASYLKHIIAIAREKKLRLNIHLSETKYEYDTCMKERGCSPCAYLDSLGMFELPALAVHCVWLDAADIELLAAKKVSIAACPASNLKLANGIAPVEKLLDAGVNVCLGTDSAASSNSLNLFTQMSLSALIHKGVCHDPTAVSAHTVFKMATQNGAAALGLENTGSIAPGMKADMAILNLDCPQMRPKNDLMAALSYSANGSEVEMVIINGEVVLEKRRMVKVDEEKLYYECDKYGGQ